ncbi:DMT family transporter [Lonepinella sp. BR2882]
MLGISSGAVSAAQTAINGKLGGLLGSTIHAAFLAFSMGR